MRMHSTVPAVQAGEAEIINRRTCLNPTVLMPTQQQWSRFSHEDREILHRLLSEPAEFIDSPVFRSPGAGRRLRRQCAALLEGQPAGALRDHQAEANLFLQYNYARLRVARLLRAHRGRRMSVKALRLLLTWSRQAIACRARIVESNLPLVLAMARRMRPACLDFSDLVSEGSFALLRSVDKFDCSRGFKFSTYACRAILKSFSRVAMRSGRYRSRFPVEFDPSLERSDYLDRQRDAKEDDCVEQISTILAENRAALNEMERQVISQRFSLAADGPGTPAKTLEQVGAMIGVTKERVRQIQNRALRKLRLALDDELWGGA